MEGKGEREVRKYAKRKRIRGRGDEEGCKENGKGRYESGVGNRREGKKEKEDRSRRKGREEEEEKEEEEEREEKECEGVRGVRQNEGGRCKEGEWRGGDKRKIGRRGERE